jgi:benzoyl-CoA reductase/2-hydroxyglutaryl-CoA dehydratase subunit BcrC/BadD/HgdB
MIAADCTEKIGFACAYTPLPLIAAAGYTPYRVLPLGDPPDQAGRWLHDNLCPHVKRVLDRVLCGDIPILSGMVLVNSCDAMRRLADALHRAVPELRVHLLDLPVFCDAGSISFLATELARLREVLAEWSGRPVESAAIHAFIEQYNELAGLLSILRERMASGSLKLPGSELQTIYNRASTEPVSETVQFLSQVLSQPGSESSSVNGVPVFLFGNVLAETAAFDLFDSCRLRIVDDDLCTGSRMFSPIHGSPTEQVLVRLARELLSRPPCARTVDPSRPGRLAEEIVRRALACNARGMIGHVAKFCDPYVGRLPMVSKMLRTAGIPLLLLEGDCAMRSIGQQRTRIEAFAEMLE